MNWLPDEFYNVVSETMLAEPAPYIRRGLFAKEPVIVLKRYLYESGLDTRRYAGDEGLIAEFENTDDDSIVMVGGKPVLRTDLWGRLDIEDVEYAIKALNDNSVPYSNSVHRQTIAATIQACKDAINDHISNLQQLRDEL